jgi:ankyrin repeat protein
LVVALEDNHPLTVLQDIVRDDPGLLRAQDEYGWMPLHHAAYEKAPLPVIEWLADEYPEALLIQTNDGSLPFLFAAAGEGASLQVVQDFADRFGTSAAEALFVANREGWAPLHFAAF